MYISPIEKLRLIYNGLLMGMPSFAYNPINKNNLLAPMYVQQYSTYVNFKLDNNQVNYINNYIKDYTDKLELIPLKMNLYEKPSYYLSVNIYNCTSPVFLNNKNITRCEINTYVKNKDGTYGTIILDYLSNSLSLDPLNIFKKEDLIYFNKVGDNILLDCNSKKEKIYLTVDYSTIKYKNYDVSKKLIDYTDNIYYKNGIMDKIYYDSTLTKAYVKQPKEVRSHFFIYKDLYFNDIDSVFYFDNKLNFVGSIWDNLYKI
tara:strand:+ start:342 stop:1118 length:777 start_codon:yes stop_codon:yes gene_type:complete